MLKHLGTLLAPLALALFITLAAPASLRAAGNVGEQAADFPPGLFSDGGQYSLADFQGKVVVLFFYEKDCPGCRGTIPQRNAVVKQFQGKPVRFFAVAAGDTFQQAKAYGAGTKLAMPVFADPLSLMERRYGQTISLQNIYQFRVIGPDGKIVGYKMEAPEIEKALAGVKLKSDPEQYHAKVRPAVDLFEWNQYAAGGKALKKLLKHKDKEVAESAARLQEVVKAELTQWSEEGATATDGDPVKAYDLYAKVAAALPKDDELSKKAAEAMKTLKSNKDVKSELDARKQYAKMLTAMGAAQPSQRAEVARFAAGIARKYPDAPTGKKAAELADELGKEVALRG